MRIGFKHPLGLRLEIIPLQLVDQVERSSDRQAAQPFLTLKDRDPGLLLVLKES